MTNTDQDPEQRLIHDYRMAGGYAKIVTDISHHAVQPAEAIPVLAAWLSELEMRWPGPESEDRRVARITLIKALGHRGSRKTSAVPALISQFDTGKPLDSNARWSAGNSLYDIPADNSYFEELAAIATNPEFGSDRQMVVDWLGKTQLPEAAAIALSQLGDEDVQGHALEALARLRAQGVRAQVEPFTKSKNKWHRRTAERILRYSGD